MKRFWINRCLMVLALAVGAYYLTYRALYTLNPEYMFFSILFLLAEIHGYIALFLFFFDIWRPLRPEPKPAVTGLSVDVYIPTYNEDVELLRKTIIGAVTMHYPHTTYVLDDGNRPEVKALAEELSAHYIAREDHSHAKAGNINHALRLTQGDYIAIFDADHVPQPDFLDQTLGFFEDERMAFVQTPQYFYNLNAFEEATNLDKDDYWEQQGLFFHQIQPGKNRWNASFFCGTCAVISRKALEEVGGIATETITEDIHTSLLMHARGWKSVYLDHHLATGLAPDDVYSYYKQRTRWSLGNMRVMFINNPLFTRGLTLAQRLSYFSSMFSWTGGLQKIMYYLTPALMLMTPLIPIKRFFPDLVVLYFIYLFTQLSVYKLVTNGRGRIFEEEVFNMLNFWLLTKSFFRALLGLGVTRFVVTQKSGTSQPFPVRMLVPQLLIFLFSFTGLTWGVLRILYQVRYDPLSIGFGMFWACYICVLSLYVMVRAFTRFNRTGLYRMPSSIPVLYRTKDNTGDHWTGRGFTIDLNEKGMTLAAYEPLSLESGYTGRLILDNMSIDVTFQAIFIQRAANEDDPLHLYTAAFKDCDAVSLDLLSLYLMNRVIPDLIGVVYNAKRETFRFHNYLPASLKARRPSWLGIPVLTAPGTDDVVSGKLLAIRDDENITISMTSETEIGAQPEIEMVSPKGLIRARALITNVNKLERGERDSFNWNAQLRFNTPQDAAIMQQLRRDK
jgi:cellulose synthase (UDP-forming)